MGSVANHTLTASCQHCICECCVSSERGPTAPTIILVQGENAVACLCLQSPRCSDVALVK